MHDLVLITLPLLCLFRFIAESAEKLELSYFIPCHGGVHCVTLSLPESNLSSSSSSSSSVAASLLRSQENVSQCLPPLDLSNTTVVAGHFFWNVWFVVRSPFLVSALLDVRTT